jgi:L-ascorbate metabolism protein UlaG (beta-lactamase superfamily)
MPGEVSRRALIGAGAAGVAASFAATAAAAAQAKVVVTRWAWAGVSFRVGDVEIFVDARRPGAEDGAPGPALSSTAGRRFALATHHHGDHLDIAGLAPLLAETGYLVLQDEVARLADGRTVKIQPVRMYEPAFLSRAGGEFAAFAVPAVDGLGSPQNSWVIDGGGKRFLHCGDTCWHGAWWDVARAYGPFDVAFLPINGARPLAGRYTDPGVPMVMDAEDAAAAASALKAGVVVPIHYGAPNTPGYFEAPGAEARFIGAARERKVRVRILQPGETMTL